LRDRHFGEPWVDEPSLAILIAIGQGMDAGRPIRLSSACYASRLPATTALRRVQILETLGLIVSQTEPADARCKTTRLTAEGRAKLTALLADIRMSADALLGGGLPA